MSKDTGEFDPHPGDPWHPDWVSSKEVAEEEFVADTTEVEEDTSRRGLFGRKRRSDEAADAAEDAAEETYEPLFAEESSVDVYEELESLSTDDVAPAAESVGDSIAEEAVTFEPEEVAEVAEVEEVEEAVTFEPE
ncbi:MAG: hypothetical protein V3R84_08175, partial [Acidimicrobiia bacterium]